MPLKPISQKRHCSTDNVDKVVGIEKSHKPVVAFCQPESGVCYEKIKRY